MYETLVYNYVGSLDVHTLAFSCALLSSTSSSPQSSSRSASLPRSSSFTCSVLLLGLSLRASSAASASRLCRSSSSSFARRSASCFSAN